MRDQPKLSLLIPFSSGDPVRETSFKWLLKYWASELPEAEVIVGHCSSPLFCKAEALNDAASRATGKVLVILDADAYIKGSVLTQCAERILEELSHGNNLWYVPYTRLYRLTPGITASILHSSPSDPLRLPSPPSLEDVENSDAGGKSKYGARYGAMVMMFPREALTTLGCFDERFKGWGGEDIALLRALDTLFGKHKQSSNDVYHLWHPYIGETILSRMWRGQRAPNANGHLASQYNRATRHPSKMRELVDAGCEYRKNK